MKSIFLGDLIYKCELLQVLTEAAIERCLEKISAPRILKHNNNNLKPT